MGTVDGHGYDGQLKHTICDAVSIDSKHTETSFSTDWLHLQLAQTTQLIALPLAHAHKVIARHTQNLRASNLVKISNHNLQQKLISITTKNMQFYMSEPGT